MGLPPTETEVFSGISFVAKQTDFYDPKKSADGFSELLRTLYQQLPYEVRRKLENDPKTKKLLGSLEEFVRG